MTIWQRILRVLGYAPPSRLAFHADEELLQSLQTIAEREQRHTGEIASELLSSALEQRQVDDGLVAHWRILSPREQQVAALTCLNFTNRQIAARLTISGAVLEKTCSRSPCKRGAVMIPIRPSAWRGRNP